MLLMSSLRAKRSNPAFLFRLSVASSLLLLAMTVYAHATDMDSRLELARKMHEYRPVRAQLDAAIEAAAAALPASGQEAYKMAIRGALNYKTIEAKSIAAMADIYTQEELEAMVAYYAKPEARSAEEKYGVYAARMEAEIIKMLDKAMMRIRTGGR